MKRFALALIAACLASTAGAQVKDTHKGSHHASGTVKSVDAGKGTVTIDHGPVSTLNWPAMSMRFKAQDKKALEALKPGQKIEFDFVRQGKDYMITRLK
jgi:Cu/Ag efflux protein CusF